MNPEEPPLLKPAPNPAPPPARRTSLSRLGMRLALVAPAIIVLMVVLQPG